MRFKRLTHCSTEREEWLADSKEAMPARGGKSRYGLYFMPLEVPQIARRRVLLASFF